MVHDKPRIVLDERNVFRLEKGRLDVAAQQFGQRALGRQALEEHLRNSWPASVIARVGLLSVIVIGTLRTKR